MSKLVEKGAGEELNVTLTTKVGQIWTRKDKEYVVLGLVVREFKGKSTHLVFVHPLEEIHLLAGMLEEGRNTYDYEHILGSVSLAFKDWEQINKENPDISARNLEFIKELQRVLSCVMVLDLHTNYTLVEKDSGPFRRGYESGARKHEFMHAAYKEAARVDKEGK